MAFQDRLRERREFLNMSRMELAEKLNITTSAIGNYENGISSPKTEILYNMFRVLDCDANYLFQDEIISKGILSNEADEVAHAYDKAEFDKQNIVRLTLGLNLKQKTKTTNIYEHQDNYAEKIAESSSSKYSTSKA
jgi:transcriptional regulator with XRE-family HTH domain